MATKHYPNMGRVYRARFVLEEGELEELASGTPIWVSFWGSVVPFNVDIGRLDEVT